MRDKREFRAESRYDDDALEDDYIANATHRFDNGRPVFTNVIRLG